MNSVKPPSFAEFYDAGWLQYDGYFAVHRERFIASWAFIAALPDKSRILDLGGICPLAAYSAKFFGSQIEQTASDLRKALDLPDNRFDLVICTETIEHIKDIESTKIEDLERHNFSGARKMLSEFFRVTKPGGHVFVTTPNSSSYISLWKWLNREPLMMDPNHVRELTIAELRALAAASGLEVSKIETIDTWAPVFGERIAALVKLLKESGMLAGEERGDNTFALLRKPG